jgi:hypothetical protein
MKNKITLKFIILLILLPLILITINPLLITIFDELYLRFIIKYTSFYLDSYDLVLDTFVNQLESEANELYEDYMDEDDPKLASYLFSQWQNTINTLYSAIGENFNNENIIIEANDHDIPNELDTNNSETDNSDSDENIDYDVGTNTDSNSDVSTNSDSDSDSGTDVNSSNSESIIPLPLLLFYRNSLTNINKIKTNWNKLITTPITLDKEKIGRKSINLKMKRLLILLQFILLTINPLLTLTFFETFFIRMLLFNTRYSFLGPHARLDDEQNINELGLEDENFALILTLQIQNIINPENNIPGVNDDSLIIEDNDSNVQNEEDAIQDALDDETEAIAAEEEHWEQLLQDLSSITGEPVEDIRNRLNVETSNTSFNPEEIIATSTPNTTSNELEVNTHSDISESIIPFLLILIHQNMLTKFNKFKTKWIKLITTPIIKGVQ